MDQISMVVLAVGLVVSLALIVLRRPLARLEIWHWRPFGLFREATARDDLAGAYLSLGIVGVIAFTSLILVKLVG